MRQHFRKFLLYASPRSPSRGRRRCIPSRRQWRPFKIPFLWTLVALATIILFTITFRPNYTHLPEHYQALRDRVSASRDLGRGNPNNERIFISVSLYDKGGHLAGGSWGRKVVELIDLLGPENTFLSIYENDSGPEGVAALRTLESKLTCPHSIVTENVDKNQFPTIEMPDGSVRLKRLTYLAEMRNRSLRPLNQASNVTYDKIIFFNDISFHTVDALHLLFSTNLGHDGRTKYTAACGIDHLNPIGMYDVYATRDMEGYSMGDQIFPFFSTRGQAQSRQDMLAQKDAVRVKSCWGGMAAFDARYFQSTSDKTTTDFDAIGAHVISPSDPVSITAPVRWRSEPEVFFDACECCLLMADVLALSQPPRLDLDTGIYINPYIRVAYDDTTLWMLKYTRRLERLFIIPQRILSIHDHLPTWNKHRTVEQGQAFQEEVWINDARLDQGGSWKVVDRRGRNGMYCGVREMQVLLQSERKEDKNWENVDIPVGRQIF